MIKNKQGKQIIIWISALIAGAILGCLGISFLNRVFNFVAEVFTRLFQFIAVPTIALAVITTLSELGAKKNTGKIFAHTITYTLLTTFCAALISLILYIIFTPDNIILNNAAQNVLPKSLSTLSYSGYLLSIIQIGRAHV